MAHKFRGEMEAEIGFGLPRLTTVDRLAYTPSADGYQVFDTDLQIIATWIDAAWQLDTPLFELGDKVDTNDGVAVNSLTLETASAVEIMTLSAANATVTAGSGTTSMRLSVNGTTNLSILPTHMTTSSVIRGVDDDNPNTLITRGTLLNIAGGYNADFVVADWSTNSGVSTIVVAASTHGLVVSAGSGYDVYVSELDSGNLTRVDIDARIDAATGDVTLTTTGLPFDGQVQISR